MAVKAIKKEYRKYRIGDVSRLLGITPEAIRYYGEKT